jgi:hypothetical protein
MYLHSNVRLAHLPIVFFHQFGSNNIISYTLLEHKRPTIKLPTGRTET